MSISEKETRIIKRIYTNRKTNNPLLVVYPNGEECKNGILTTLTNGHVVTHIALERKEKEKVKYVPGMISGAGIEHINPDTQEIDFK